MKASRQLQSFVEGLLLLLLAVLLQSIFNRNLGNIPLSFDIGIVLMMFYAFRRGAIPGFIAGLCYGLADAYLAGQFLNVPWLSLLMALGGLMLGFAGCFARNLQRTLHNRRLSSTYLNLVTGTLLASLAFYICDFLRLQCFVQSNLAMVENFKTAGLSFLANTGIALAILLVMINVSSRFFIPKNTPYITRRERSRLLND